MIVILKASILLSGGDGRNRDSHGFLERQAELMKLILYACFMNPGQFKFNMFIIIGTDQESLTDPPSSVYDNQLRLFG